jgi:signal peptidase I
MNTLLLVTLFGVAWLALQAAVLWRAVRFGRTLRLLRVRAAVLVGIRFAAAVGLWATLATLIDEAAGAVGLAVAAVCADIVVTAVLVRLLFGGRARTAFRAWVAQFAGGAAAAFLVFVAAGTCLGAAFIPNSSMSPNIRGYHTIEPLPDGTHLVVAANTPGDARGIPAGEPSGAVVAETYEFRDVVRPARHTFSADRFVWNKTRAARRWDAVAFSYPDQPTDTIVKRLIGLPGERIEIRDGAAWANGERLIPPARLGPIRYTAQSHRWGNGAWNLGPDECFLLGDNTDHCFDSRHRGPVPFRLIDGVVDAIYWPPGRWRLNP